MVIIFVFQNERTDFNDCLKEIRTFQESHDFSIQIEQFLKETMTADDKKNINDDKDWIKLLDFKSIEITETIRNKSPFCREFQEDYNKMMARESKMDFTRDKNTSYRPQFLHNFVNDISAYYSLWSAAMIKRFEILRNTNKTVENNFKITKKYFFP